MITATFERVPGGYLLNGTMFLTDPSGPDWDAAAKATAQAWADRIDAELAQRVYGVLFGDDTKK